MNISDNRYCLICGKDNPIGLKAHVQVDEQAHSATCRVAVPAEFQGWQGIVHGGIIGALTSRRGQVTGQEPRGNAVAIAAMVPLANMFGYINTLRSMSSGRAQFTMQFDHYDPVPQNISDEIQSKYA